MNDLKVGDLRMEIFENEVYIHKVTMFESFNAEDKYVCTIYYVDGELYDDADFLYDFISRTVPINKFFKRLYNVEEMFND